MPSATMKSVPFSPTRWVRTLGWSDASFVVRSATTNASSLCSRVRPTSVRPNTWTRISLWSGVVIGLVALALEGEVTISLGAGVEENFACSFQRLRALQLSLNQVQRVASGFLVARVYDRPS